MTFLRSWCPTVEHEPVPSDYAMTFGHRMYPIVLSPFGLPVHILIAQLVMNNATLRWVELAHRSHWSTSV
jgi:hypothetical protein